MPNWCYNSLTIEGSQEEIKAIKEQLNKPYTQDHENYDMEKGEMAWKTYEYNNPVFAFWNIIRPADEIMDVYRLQRDPKSKSNLTHIQFDGDNWYDWNVRNWGTKWDVAVSDDSQYPDTNLAEETDTTLCYIFNTAWSPPSPAIAKLSEQYPNATFTLSFEEETGWGGEYQYVDGNETEIESYESKCRDCDAINTMEYCENDCGEICSECHYLGEADMECVEDCEVHREFVTTD